MCNVTLQMRTDARYRYLDAVHLHLKFEPLLVFSLWQYTHMNVDNLRNVDEC